MKKEPYSIGTLLKHKKTKKIIELLRYHTQIVHSLHLSIGGNNMKTIPNYDYLYGREIESGQKVSGLTEDFMLYEQ